ncbi:citrate-binding protein-like [Neltuma alba]|uniref:citrate-binding protein-like n=1 Tax=Neltuma alba TaxID=207710 RepID=UPI0010A46DDB|nr:citrate-binding protein-like [Prosopis alba]
MKVGRMVQLWMLQVIVSNLIILEASEALDPTQGFIHVALDSSNFKKCIIYEASEAADPTHGFIPVALDSSNFHVQKPYDVPVNQRYSFSNGVHKLCVYSTDKPHTTDSPTLPRTEIRIAGHDYTSGVWQFEGYGYVPNGTSGVCIMQVFGARHPHATTLQLRVYDASLISYMSPVLLQNMYDRWFRLNAIVDVAANNVKVYIDGVLKYTGGGRGQATHYFKFGVFTQNDPSHYMESRWKDIKLFRK